MKKNLTIVAATVVALLLLFLLFIYSGIYNVSQTAEHNPLVRWAINTTKERSVHSRADDINVPSLNDTAMIQAGFVHYNTMCVACHGKPGSNLSELAKGLTPQPPQLFEHAGDEEAGELFWVIKNGIKFTAMPAFGPTHTDKDIWNIVAFLKSKSGMSAAEFSQWQERTSGSSTDSSNGHTSDGHTH